MIGGFNCPADESLMLMGEQLEYTGSTEYIDQILREYTASTDQILLQEVICAKELPKAALEVDYNLVDNAGIYRVFYEDYSQIWDKFRMNEMDTLWHKSLTKVSQNVTVLSIWGKRYEIL